MIIKKPSEKKIKKKFSANNILKNVETLVPMVVGESAGPSPIPSNGWVDNLGEWIGDNTGDGFIFGE